MKNKYAIITRESFKQAYHSQYVWSLENHGLRQTDKYFAQVDRMIEGLMQSPKLYKERKNGYRYIPVKSAYILYRINEDKKQIELIDFIAKHRVHEFL